MEYKYLNIRDNLITLKEDEVAHKPTLDEILDLWINDKGNHTTNLDNWEKENERIKERFEEFKHYLEENKIDEPWIGLNKLGLFPFKWIKAFKKGDKVKIAMFNPLTFENRRWVNATVTSFMEDFTKVKNDGVQYYAVDIHDMDTCEKNIHFFAPSCDMFREGEELPDIDVFVDALINKIKK